MIALVLVVAALGTDAVGINTHQPDWPRLDAAADLGLAVIRIDLNWLEAEPVPGGPDWSLVPTDAIVAGAAARGLLVYATVAYGPAWASTGNADGLSSTNDVPDLAAWDAFVRAAVGRYGATVKHWGLWNEPNLGGFFEGSALDYADVARAGARAVHETCGDCLALGPELANLSGVDAFLEDVLAAMDPPGSIESFDLLTHHSYSGFSAVGGSNTFVTSLDVSDGVFGRTSFRELVVNAGWGEVEVWITETGYSAPLDDAPALANQALYYELVLAEQLARAWWTRTLFYEITDDPTRPDGVREGITFPVDGGASTDFHDWLTFKPAYDTLRTAIATTPALGAADEPPAPLASLLADFASPRTIEGGSWAVARARFVNIGAGAWPADTALVPGGDAPLFVDGPIALETSVAPGGERELFFQLTAPPASALSPRWLTFRLSSGGVSFGDTWQISLAHFPGGETGGGDGGTGDAGAGADAGGGGGGGGCACAAAIGRRGSQAPSHEGAWLGLACTALVVLASGRRLRRGTWPSTSRARSSDRS